MIEQKLAATRIADSLATEVLEASDHSDKRAASCQISLKKLRGPTGARFLLRKGFDEDLVRSLLGDHEGE